ncbi:MAG: RNA methyltransferase [Cyanobacteria bacterium J06648_16]
MGDLDRIRIVLVEPAGPLNVGAAARVMKNFGLSQLVLVNPHCDPLDDLALQMAVHAKDVLLAARQVPTLAEALAGCELAIATTARDRDLSGPLALPEAELPHLLAPQFTQTALVFGPESRGLNNEELYQAQRFIKIPTDPAYASLNLAQAVALCCYDIARLNRGQPLSNVLTSGTSSSIRSRTSASDRATQTAPPADLLPPPDRPAALDELDGYYHHLESVLLKIGYLYPHTAPSRMRKFRQLLNRAMPTTAEVALLRGVLRQVEWALAQTSDD